MGRPVHHRGQGRDAGSLSNQQGRGFQKLPQSSVARGDQTAVIGWPNGLGQRRLLVATSNLEFTPDAEAEIAVHPLPTLGAPQNLNAGWASPGPLTTADIDGDGTPDLALATEWGAVRLFLNRGMGSLFPWARFRSTKAAIKLHALLDVRGPIPTMITISDGKQADVGIEVDPDFRTTG
jgi:hypothetical protein